ncbi:calcium/calmodulin-dependent protein kinase [Apiospora kogelbergensis]|uniref:calcium/calmodulin-dependent protein kinase n=1 Tax=Apiospora kogelbergensis TaxID=1337665 RepID=UPI0031318DD1
MTEPVTATAPPTAPEQLAPPNERTRSDTTSSRDAGHAANPDIKTLLASPDNIHPCRWCFQHHQGEAALAHGAHFAVVSSAPAAQQYQSPLRHHKRTPSQHREVKVGTTSLSFPSWRCMAGLGEPGGRKAAAEMPREHTRNKQPDFD